MPFTRDDFWNPSGSPGEVWPVDKLVEHAKEAKAFLHTYDNADYAEKLLIPGFKRLAAEVERLRAELKKYKDQYEREPRNPDFGMTITREPGW